LFNRKALGSSFRWNDDEGRAAHPQASAYKSRQYGLDFSMSSIFHACFYALIALSRAIADSIVS